MYLGKVVIAGLELLIPVLSQGEGTFFGFHSGVEAMGRLSLAEAWSVSS